MTLFKSLILLTSFMWSLAFGSKDLFSKKDIVFPVGKPEIEKFMDLLKNPENQKTVGLAKGPINYKEIPEEGSAVFGIGSESYMLYWDDFNNDGKKEYLIIYVMSGSGKYSGVHGAYSLKDTKLSSLKFDDIVVKNLFPEDDMSRFHLYLALPFAVHKEGQIVLRFKDDIKKSEVATYIWNGTKFSKINSN